MMEGMDSSNLRQGSAWTQTHSLRQFWPFAPSVSDVCMEDVAWATAHLCRFAGHVSRFYSVAEHQLRTGYLVEKRAKREQLPWRVRVMLGLEGHTHDGAETWYIDLPNPIKRHEDMRTYRQVESQGQHTLYEYLGLNGFGESAMVKAADQTMCYTEARDLFDGTHPAWEWKTAPDPDMNLAPSILHRALALLLLPILLGMGFLFGHFRKEQPWGKPSFWEEKARWPFLWVVEPLLRLRLHLGTMWAVEARTCYLLRLRSLLVQRYSSK